MNIEIYMLHKILYTNFQLTSLFDEHSYNPSQVLNMDESAIYLDSPPGNSYSKKGASRVKASTVGAGRVRLSTAWSASASGIKLPIYALIPKVTRVPDLHEVPNLIVKYKSSSTFDAEAVIDWITQVVIPYKEQRKLDRILLLIDKATCHVSSKVI